MTAFLGYNFHMPVIDNVLDVVIGLQRVIDLKVEREASGDGP
jgi:hypothetical protein